MMKITELTFLPLPRSYGGASPHNGRYTSYLPAAVIINLSGNNTKKEDILTPFLRVEPTMAETAWQQECEAVSHSIPTV